MTEDAYDLARFVEAQRASYDRALAEIRSGHKRSPLAVDGRSAHEIFSSGES